VPAAAPLLRAPRRVPVHMEPARKIEAKIQAKAVAASWILAVVVAVVASLMHAA
jgi:hypothetical protein